MTSSQESSLASNRSFKPSNSPSGNTDIADLTQENLGQVFTSDIVAELMIDLLTENLEGNLILDPCIGRNVFFEILERKEHKIGRDFIKIGVEVDPRIAPIEWFSQKHDCRLYLQNFFDFKPPTKFDGIIMNPPYVRQEDLANSVINSKQKIIKALERDYFSYIAKKQNLYVYFFMKAHEVLKDYGRVVAICYDSWLYTQFGRLFKRFLDENFQVHEIIHFEESAFVNADVGATVLQMSRLPLKMNEKGCYKFKYTKFKKPEDYRNENIAFETKACAFADLPTTDDELVHFPSDLFIRLSDLAEGRIRRGLSPKANKLFLFDAPRFKETVPIIKEVKRIDGFVVSSSDLNYIIKADGTYISSELQRYLNSIKPEMRRTGRYNSIKDGTGTNERWREIKFVQPGSFLINYYLRKNIKFIYNPEKYYASDNFYIFDVSVDPILAVALLNSILTRISVLKNSRTQGKGLRKIQLYEFREVLVLNPALLRTEEVSELRKLGTRLIHIEKTSHEKALWEIDQLLLRVYNRLANTEVSLNEAYEFFRRNMGKRN
jgi:hypothetical protein